MINFYRRSFTLLEMLVVIGIIAILVAMGAVSYSTVQKKARDAKRKTDLKAIQNVLEQCYSINNYLYPDLSGGLTGSATCGTSTLTYPTTDPLGSTYVCNSCNTSSYQICPPVVRTGHRLESDDSCPTTGTSCCVSNQQ